MTDPTASAAKAARLDAAMATEFAAYAHRHGLTVTGDLTATGNTLGGTMGPQHARRDLEALMRKWGGQFTATENEDGTLTVSGTLALTATPDPPSGPTILYANALTGGLSDLTQFSDDAGNALATGGAGTTLTVAPYSDLTLDRLLFTGETATRILSVRCGITINALNVAGDPAQGEAIILAINPEVANPTGVTATLSLIVGASDTVTAYLPEAAAQTHRTATLAPPVPRGQRVVVELVQDHTDPEAQVSRCYVDGALAAATLRTGTPPLPALTLDQAISVGIVTRTAGTVASVTYDHLSIADGYQGVPD